MPILRLKTNLRCKACVVKITPVFDAAAGITHWSADIDSPDKVLTVEGPEITRAQVENLLRLLDYEILAVLNDQPAPGESAGDKPTTYYPLFLVLAYLAGGSLLLEAGMIHTGGAWNSMRLMRHFMAGFFLIFSFFKLLNLQAFADAYEGYDIVARRWPFWGMLYPWVELGLGVSYLAHFLPVATYAITLLVMSVSSIGVVQTVLARRTIRCACLGTVFNLPMSTVTIVEDLLMVAMAAGMLWMTWG